MQDPTVVPGPWKPTMIVHCRECGTRIYPRKSPAGPMAFICDCSREAVERALAGAPGLEVEPAEK